MRQLWSGWNIGVQGSQSSRSWAGPFEAFWRDQATVTSFDAVQRALSGITTTKIRLCPRIDKQRERGFRWPAFRPTVSRNHLSNNGAVPPGTMPSCHTGIRLVDGQQESCPSSRSNKTLFGPSASPLFCVSGCQRPAPSTRPAPHLVSNGHAEPAAGRHHQTSDDVLMGPRPSPTHPRTLKGTGKFPRLSSLMTKGPTRAILRFCAGLEAVDGIKAIPTQFQPEPTRR